ncbi:MAG TPA: hypothetical protein VK403_10890 [Allosphingosinicella sp.]|nr:hypothetical protein [Allosphingosinicella sp.]
MAITPCKREKIDFGTLDPLIKQAVAAQLAFAGELLNIAGAGAQAVLGRLGRRKLPRRAQCCDIPEACWMPKGLGEIECELRPDGTGQVKLIVTNNDFRARNLTVRSAGAGAGMVTLGAVPATLGPKERVTVVAHFAAPGQHGTHEGVLWVSLCSDHYLRWTIRVGERESACCYEVTVDDNPDYVVHWYDHFYCPKPCLGVHGRQG